MRPKRRYVRRDEIKVKERRPTDGQAVLYRVKAQKHYCRGVYDGKSGVFMSGMNFISVAYVMGWLPLKQHEEERE